MLAQRGKARDALIDDPAEAVGKMILMPPVDNHTFHTFPVEFALRFAGTVILRFDRLMEIRDERVLQLMPERAVAGFKRPQGLFFLWIFVKDHIHAPPIIELYTVYHNFSSLTKHRCDPAVYLTAAAINSNGNRGGGVV